MSTTVVAPGPTPLTDSDGGLIARMRSLLTEMNLHFAGVIVLFGIVLYSTVHLVLLWQALKANGPDAQAAQRVELRKAQIAAIPLHGLDTKLATSTHEADNFYAARLPYAYSEVAAELGVLTHRANVRLGHVQYTGAQVPNLNTQAALTEVRMDATISGDYRPTVEFINAVERDKRFFVINSINLSGQQGGRVNLRIRLTTYLRAPNEKEAALEFALPSDATAAPAGETTPAGQPTQSGGPR